MDFEVLMNVALLYWAMNVAYGTAMLASKAVRRWTAQLTRFTKE